MVKALEKEQESYRSKLFHFKGMFDSTGRHTKSLSIESANKLEASEEDPVSSRSQGSRPLNDLDKGPIRPRVVSKEEIEAKEIKEKLLQGKT